MYWWYHIGDTQICERHKINQNSPLKGIKNRQQISCFRQKNLFLPFIYLTQKSCVQTKNTMILLPNEALLSQNNLQEPTFVPSSSLHMQIPGCCTCRLPRLQTLAVGLLFNFKIYRFLQKDLTCSLIIAENRWLSGGKRIRCCSKR